MKTARELILQRHRHLEAKLDAIREAQIAALAHARDHAGSRTGHLQAICGWIWRELFLPYRRAWVAIGAAWLVILALQVRLWFDARTSTTVWVTEIAPPANAVSWAEAMRERQRLWVELIGVAEQGPATPPQSVAPRPRHRSSLEWIPVATLT